MQILSHPSYGGLTSLTWTQLDFFQDHEDDSLLG